MTLHPLKLLAGGFLIITLTACQTKAPTPAPRPIVSTTLGDEMTLMLTGARMPCQFARPMQCLVAMDEHGKSFSIAYDSIEDFIPINNRQYTIKVRPKLNSYATDDNQNAIIGYKLIEVLSQQ